MKKVLALLLAAAMVFSLSACGNAAATAPAATEAAKAEAAPEVKDANGDDEIFVALLAQCTNGFYFKKYIATFEEICKENGYKYVVMDANFDAPTQISQIENAIAQGVDAIFLTTVDSSAVVEAVKKAYDAGIPVMTGHAQLVEDAWDYIVGFAGSSQEEIGTNTGKLIHEATGGKGKMVVIGSSFGTKDIDTYEACVKKEAGEGVEWIAEYDHGWDRTKAYEAMENALTQYDDIDIVWSMDDNTAIGCVNAIQDAGREGIKVVGINGQDIAFDAIKEGTMYGTVIQSPGDNVKLMFKQWDAWKKGEDYEFLSYSESPIITKDNVDKFEPAF